MANADEAGKLGLQRRRNIACCTLVKDLVCSNACMLLSSFSALKERIKTTGRDHLYFYPENVSSLFLPSIEVLL